MSCRFLLLLCCLLFPSLAAGAGVALPEGWDAPALGRALEAEHYGLGLVARDDVLWTRTPSLWVAGRAFVPMRSTLSTMDRYHRPAEPLLAPGALLDALERALSAEMPEAPRGPHVYGHAPVLHFDGEHWVAVETLQAESGLECDLVSGEVPLVRMLSGRPTLLPAQLLDPDSEKFRAANAMRQRRERGFHRVAYLTFDDGPSARVTPAILDILRERQVRATFFVLGKEAERRPELLRRIADEGHAIGHHSYSHDYDKLYRRAQGPGPLMEEVARCEALFREVLGHNPRLLRAPGGVHGHFTPAYFERLREAGYRIVEWNLDSRDSRSLSVTAEEIVEQVRRGMQGRPELVVLMHDSATKQENIRALPEIIAMLREARYELKPLTEDTVIYAKGVLR